MNSNPEPQKFDSNIILSKLIPRNCAIAEWLTIEDILVFEKMNKKNLHFM